MTHPALSGLTAPWRGCRPCYCQREAEIGRALRLPGRDRAIEMSGRVALVTGAASGIGRATAIELASGGAAVVVADVNVEGGRETLRMIEVAGGRGRFVMADVSDASAVGEMVAEAVGAFGRLDCAVNNAGREGPRAKLADTPEDAWASVISTNLTGVWLCMRAEVRQMLAQKPAGGAIVNVSSVAGLTALAGHAPYAASKHGIIGLTRTGAVEYARNGIRVNAVCPGLVLTPMTERSAGATPGMLERLAAAHPIGRGASPEEIARAIAWLCSDGASYVTGQAMAIDGGLTAQ